MIHRIGQFLICIFLKFNKKLQEIKKEVEIQMKSEKGITLVKLIFIVGIIIVGIILISNSSKSSTKIEWGYIPSPEYYELRLAATTSELYGAGSGTLSQASFNTLGKDIKKAKGKWFKDSNINFKASVLDNGNTEITTLSDGEHTATFTFDYSSNYVYYTFKNEDHAGYRITIK